MPDAHPDRLAADLKQALARGEFTLHYQPRIGLMNGRAHGAEALIRWDHPVFGQLPPDQFIPLAERSGAIGEIGAWVLRQATAEAMSWSANCSAGAGLVVAVNVSTQQLRQGRLLADVVAALRATGLPAQRLEVELTESLAIGRAADIAQLRGLRELGVGVALDDFGTGGASLATLKRLPLTTIKLDRAFVDGLPGARDMAIARAAGALAAAFDLALVAEGVETPRQRDALLSLGFAEAQGFLLGRPKPAEAIRALFE